MTYSKYDVVDCFRLTDDVESKLVIGNVDEAAEPTLSVVIPTYMRTDMLRQAVLSACHQEGFDEEFEIVVVDNDAEGKSDTETMLRAACIPNLLYYRNSRNLGAVGNWNRGIMLAHSKWVVMCHDDDWLKPDCLATVRDIINKHSNDRKPIGYINASAESYYGPGIVQKVRTKRLITLRKPKTALQRMTYANVIWGGGCTWAGAPTCGSLINRDAAIEVGGYNEKLAPCPDCYVPYHMLHHYSVYKTCHPLGCYRWQINDTYRKPTIIGLITEYNDFLEMLSRNYPIVRFFSNEHYAQCVQYYRIKAAEADVELTDDEIDDIRTLSYSRVKLHSLMLIRKAHSFLQYCLAR